MDQSSRVHSICLTACMLVACGGGGDGSDSSPPVVIPPEASAADAKVKEQMSRFVALLDGAQSGFIFILNPDAGLTPGVTLIPDPQPGAPANSYVFDGTFDGNDDGVSETALSGRVTYAGDPSSLDWSPLTGEATLDVEIPVVGHVYQATVAFTAEGTELLVSGNGTFTNPLTGEVTTIEIPAGEPLVVKPASGAGSIVANACGYNVDGTVPTRLTGSTGTLEATWQFSASSTSAAVQQVSFRNPAGETTAMPDTTVDLTCGAGGTTDDWEAVYDQHWACLPLEYGHAELTLTATGATTLSITDEDPPGSGDINTFDATLVSASPHAAKGFFDGGPVGNRYREYFTWTLGKDGGFSQWSQYAYTEGPNLGAGGVCAAIAKRLP